MTSAAMPISSELEASAWPIPADGARSEEMVELLAQFHKLCTEQARIIREQAAALAHSETIFARASQVARIGVWECELPHNAIRWSEVVYDIFGIERGRPIDRETTLNLYNQSAREALEAIRTKAIEQRTGFKLDVEITTPAGEPRWVRITATVDCEGDVPIRIFGMKQDITEEKLLANQTHYLANYDVTTGLANRSRFQAELTSIENHGERDILLLIDLDRFKEVNDTLGHAVGDECLRVAASRIRDACPDARLVSRIGGDEFAVLLGSAGTRPMAGDLARDIVEALGRPIPLPGGTCGIGASVGIALHEGGSCAELFVRADLAMYEAKAQGRNCFRFASPGRGALPANAGTGS